MKLTQLDTKIDDIKKSLAVLEKSIAPTNRKIDNLRNKLTELCDKAEALILSENKSTVALFEENDAEYIFIDRDREDGVWRVGEDDGTLHINFGKVRGCFICNQDISAKEWKADAKKVLEKLNVPKEVYKGAFDYLK